jgi:flagellar biogenesis protein FliO
METAELLLRSAGGLLAVLGTLWVLVRVVRARNAATGTVPVARLRVLARASVGRRASVVTVDAGDRVLLLGVADGAVRLLAEQPPTPAATVPVQRVDLDLPGRSAPGADDADAAHRGPVDDRGHASPLAGSLVDPATWRQVVHTAREWTVRR